MEVIGDVVARERRSDDLAIRVDSRAGSYSYEKCCTSAWKAGNLFSHFGVHGGATVAIDASDASPTPIQAFLGSALLGAPVRFDPPETPEAAALVCPTDRVDRYQPGPGTKVFASGDPPSQAGVAHFERDVWSENPTAPPDEVSPDAVALHAGGSELTHGQVLDAAAGVVAGHDITAADEVTLRAPLSNPGAVVAGVLAPLVAGATVLLDTSRTGTLAVGGADSPEDRVVDPDAVL